MMNANFGMNNSTSFLSATPNERTDWRRAHDELSRLAKTRAHLDWEEARWLLAALRSGAHVELGFATFGEYIERLFGYVPRWTSERLRVAEALERLSELDQALRDGTMSWSAVRELTRVAVPENEHQWLEITRGRSLRQTHHRAVHRGQLIIEGRVSTGLSFRHADGAWYGSAVQPSVAEANSEAFRALRALGFREDETRKALQRVRDDTHMGQRTTEGVLRAALSWLASNPSPARSSHWGHR